MDQKEQIVFDVLYGRRSIRHYQDNRAVEHEKIVTLLQAAMAAPSACNIQPWEFIVVTDEETVSQIKGSIERWGDYNAPLIIVVCSYPALIPWGSDGVIDCSAAIENILIAATAMGLGSVWIGGFHPPSIRRILNIPEDVVPQGLVYLGYPAEQPAPRTQYLEELVHWQRYDPSKQQKPRPGDIIQRD